MKRIYRKIKITDFETILKRLESFHVHEHCPIGDSYVRKATKSVNSLIAKLEKNKNGVYSLTLQQIKWLDIIKAVPNFANVVRL